MPNNKKFPESMLADTGALKCYKVYDNHEVEKWFKECLGDCPIKQDSISYQYLLMSDEEHAKLPKQVQVLLWLHKWFGQFREKL